MVDSSRQPDQPVQAASRGVLQPYVDARREEGRSAGTINHGLKVVRWVLNRIAMLVVEAMRGKHASHVFCFQGKSVLRMLNGAWLRARSAVGLPQVRVHDLKHTFGRRLRAASVSFEDRQDLLGHRAGGTTTHYSAAELSHLIEAANSVRDRQDVRQDLVVLRPDSAPAETHAKFAQRNSRVNLMVLMF